MIYPDFFEQKIGFSEIRILLKGRCMSTLGTEWVDKQLRFMTRPDDIQTALAQAGEFARFVVECDDDIENEFFDVRESLLHVRPERTYMEELDLFNLKRSLQTILAYVAAFTRVTDGKEKEKLDRYDSFMSDAERPGENPVLQESYRYPALAAMADGVACYPEIVHKIDAVLNKYGKVKDTASPELLSLRHQIEVTVRSISHSLRTIITQAQTDGYIDRDVSPTLRDGRLVIPVAPALKRKIRGIVHDESATGKTVFIEPAVVVDANNKIRELRAAERREIIRILQELTAFVRPHIQEMLQSLHFLAHVDFLRAQAAYTQQIGAIVPRLSDKPGIDWAQAVHPLLQQSLARHGEKVVPLDVVLQREQRILLISGPNAGGKSVCLKTIGLLQYMVQCGMPIPVGEQSRVGIFADIFIDIGDEQSIENDLSTYSSHLLNMKQMMRFAGQESLLLIDEFGGGTEPQIGGALAEAILDRFVKIGTYGIITTHYQNLKHYAEKSKVVVNGAMLYDRAQMRPLFMLQVGNPGSSFAVEIARKIGIPEEVIRYASDLVGQDYVMSDKYLQDIVRDKMYYESKRRNIRKREKQLEDAIARYEHDLTEFQQERRTVLAQAKMQAQQLLEQANARIENTIRTIREAQAEKEKTREVRQDLQQFKEELLQDKDEEDRIARKIAKIQRRQQRRSEKNSQPPQPRSETLSQAKEMTSADGHAMSAKESGQKLNAASLKAGAYVRIKGQSVVGRIESLSGNAAKVLFGMMYTQVPLSRLETAAAPPKEEDKLGPASTFVSKQTRDAMYEKKLHFKPELDIRGMHIDEALTAVSYFIDDAIQFEQARVRILHGTGTGALRELVRNYLAGVPGVRAYHDEHVQFGGAGITVVELS